MAVPTYPSISTRPPHPSYGRGDYWLITGLNRLSKYLPVSFTSAQNTQLHREISTPTKIGR